jgi:hypothetical protein
MNGVTDKQILAELGLDYSYGINLELSRLSKISLFPAKTIDQLENDRGLCSGVLVAVHELILHSIFKEWEHFSGEPYYPV